jgi:hypothetical protein
MWTVMIRRTPVILHKRPWLFSKLTCSSSKQLGHPNEHWCSGAGAQRPSRDAQPAVPEHKPLSSVNRPSSRWIYIMSLKRRREEKRRGGRRKEGGWRQSADRRVEKREEERSEEKVAPRGSSSLGLL